MGEPEKPDKLVLITLSFRKVEGEAQQESNETEISFWNDSEKASRFDARSIDVSGFDFCKISFQAIEHTGNAGVFSLLEKDGNPAIEMPVNSTAVVDVRKLKRLIPSFRIMGQSSLDVSDLSIEFFEDQNRYDAFLLEGFSKDVLEITPSYPAEDNRYLCGFVHSRLKAYQEAGKEFDVAVAYQYKGYCRYEFEGIAVTRMAHCGLRKLLQAKTYKTIAVHFFDKYYAQVFDACLLDTTRLFFWAHGVETLYRDWPEFATGYFKKKPPISDKRMKEFKELDSIVKRFSDMKNVTWVFVSDWIRKRSEELIGIKFGRYITIPNFIDPKCFEYRKKPAESRKHVFFIRRFDNIAKYAIDVNVRAILELSRRPCFNDMQFHIYGAGTQHATLVRPLRQFDNVHIHQRFLSHEEIAAVHQRCGIALFATRYDAQGVSMCEAAMSGLAVVSSDNEVCRTFLPDDQGLLAPTENYIAYADIIERLHNDEAAFASASAECHNKALELCGFGQTIEKEMSALFDAPSIKSAEETVRRNASQPILTIAIPAYNAQDDLDITVTSVMSQKNADKLDVIIVNDGSSDSTSEVAHKLASRYNDPNGAPVIRVVDKPNGGHGSGINVGIELAEGRYFRILDADDRMVSSELEKLVDVLERETCDIVLSDYAEDHFETNVLAKRELYNFMEEGTRYIFDDLCYPKYGFGKWGPLLATGSYKTDMLQAANFKLTEKCFYVDMEFDMYAICNAVTVSHYPLDIYRYVIGDEGQSISRESYERNYPQHEKVIFNLINYLETHDELSEQKRKYVTSKLIIPMINVQYRILMDWLKDKDAFAEFDSRLSQHKSIYRDKRIGGTSRLMKFHRKTNGRFVAINEAITNAQKTSKEKKGK